MSGDMAVLAAQVMPYVSSAVGAYGGAVLADIKDEAADATVSLGRRLLQRIFGTQTSGQNLPEPLADVVADPGDEDAIAALRLTVRKTLEADTELQHDVKIMLAPAEGTAAASGEQSIAARSISGVAITGNASDVFNIGGTQNNITVNTATRPLTPQTVQITTLLPPGTGSILRAQAYEDIHFFGPAMVFLMNGDTFDSCVFDIEQNNMESILWEIHPRFGVGVIGVERCIFRRCRFTGIGFMGIREVLDQLRVGIKPRT